MTTHSAERLQHLFSAAIELPEAEREAFLQAACVGEPELLSEVIALLAIDERLANRTLRPIAVELTRMVAAMAPVKSMLGQRVGVFELREALGHGGMGTVYRAERVDGNVDQQVAIKFIRRELLDANSLRRFHLERQTLASLEHPNIARLLDAAELADGTPYFVMEYVAGTPITAHCDQAQLDPRARVALFRTVCAAVMEAHRSLVVHRDLKPGNILVTSAGVPKLLDFGIAKPLTIGTDANQQEQTGTAHRYFSPLYSAPEQLLGGAISVGCDVYALGLLLYELLAGTRPFDFTDLSAGQIERMVTTVPPAAPSAAALRIGASSQKARALRGDLDGIVLRCLRKAANERYASVEQLDAELANYLEGRPVQARGGHGWYRAQKFLRRNKLAVAATAATAVTLVMGVVSFAWQARTARQHATELAQVAKFQSEMLAQIDETQAGLMLSKDVTALFERALVDDYAPDEERAEQMARFSELWARINATDAARNFLDSSVISPAATAVAKQFSSQPLLEATLDQSLADLYEKLGKFEAALPLQQKSLDIRRALLPALAPDLLTSIDGMGVLVKRLGKLEDAEKYLREALSKRRQALGEDHPQTLATYSHLGNVLWQSGQHVEAEAMYRESMDRSRRVLGDDHIDTLTAINGVALALDHQGRGTEAEPYVREVMDRANRTLAETDRFRLQSINNMGSIYWELNNSKEAERYLREAADAELRVLGRDHPDSAYSAYLLADFLLEQENAAEAERYLRRSLETRRMLLGNRHSQTFAAMRKLAVALLELGQFDESEKLLRETIDVSRQTQGPDARVLLAATVNLGDLLVATGRYQEAISILAPIKAQTHETFVDSGLNTIANRLAYLGRAKVGAGDYRSAESDLLEAQAEYEKSDEVHEMPIARCAESLVRLYELWHRREPHAGHDRQMAHWQERLSAMNNAHPVLAVPRLKIEITLGGHAD